MPSKKVRERHRQYLEQALKPRIFKPRLEELMQSRGKTLVDVAQALDCVPITAQRIIEGADVKLSYAVKLSRMFGASVTEIWGV